METLETESKEDKMMDFAFMLVVPVTAITVLMVGLLAVLVNKLPEGAVKEAVENHREKRSRLDLVYDEINGVWTWGPVK